MVNLLLLLAVAAMPDTSFGYDEGPTIAFLFRKGVESSSVRLTFPRYLKQYLKLLACIRGLPCSNFGRDAVYFHVDLLFLFSLLPGKDRHS